MNENPQPPLGATPEPSAEKCHICGIAMRVHPLLCEPSATPRTDAALIDNADLHDEGYGKSHMVDGDFARTLETELATARAALAQCEERLKETQDGFVVEYREQTKRFRSLVESAEAKLAQCEEKLRLATSAK